MIREKILIVDDQPAELEMMQEILDREGYETAAVGSGEEAMQLAPQAFDLLLTDIVMPHMGGLELIQAFQEVSPETVPVLITGYASIETARAAIQHGAYDYIVKPFDRAELCTAVAKALERKKLADENIRLKELVGLYRVSQSMVRSEDQREVLKFILNSGISQTKSSGGAILLFDSLKRGMVIAAAAGAWEVVARFANALLERGIRFWTGDMEEAILFTDVEQHPLFERVSHRYPDRGFLPPKAKGMEVLLLPIRSDNEILGLLNVFREGAPRLFGEGDLELLTILATQTGALIKSRQLFTELEDSSFRILCSIASWVDSRSLCTQGHMKKVAELSEQLAPRISLSEAEIEAIKQAALVHDIGMIGVSESILNMPGELTSQEWDIVKLHPVIGEEILSHLPFLSEARNIVKHHHERLDGSGYPDGLSGRQITSAVQVVSICDAYHALTSPRPWRPAFSKEEAVATLQGEKGAKFDPDIIDTFVDMVKERK
ncbi:MAG: response regulator [Dehalococcoidia bacterium]|jgi:response regulator RpfG family c-di-GMP phosphodiesterase|nr:response regulator [Chloroflexota bacterium]MCK4242929.1 response regulator [Dehalococcoidia bacterium]